MTVTVVGASPARSKPRGRCARLPCVASPLAIEWRATRSHRRRNLARPWRVVRRGRRDVRSRRDHARHVLGIPPDAVDHRGRHGVEEGESDEVEPGFARHYATVLHRVAIVSEDREIDPREARVVAGAPGGRARRPTPAARSRSAGDGLSPLSS